MNNHVQLIMNEHDQSFVTNRIMNNQLIVNDYYQSIANTHDKSIVNNHNRSIITNHNQLNLDIYHNQSIIEKSSSINRKYPYSIMKRKSIKDK